MIESPSLDLDRAEIATHPAQDVRWPAILQAAFGHQPYTLVAREQQKVVGELRLALVKSPFFGRFLVSLPYVNSAGIVTEEPQVATALLDRAVLLADELRVRYLELRNETAWDHPKLDQQLSSKVHMRLALPPNTDELWSGYKAKVRNQIRKGEQHNFQVAWGGTELLDDFYSVFSTNMRDLGTPVYGRRLFRTILEQFGDRAELCCLRDSENKPAAAALLIHGSQVTEVPSASCLRTHRSTNANMYMYHNLLSRAVERGRTIFDFGRSTVDGPTYRFKKQWGAEPSPAVWQYYLRQGQHDAMRPENDSYGLAIRVWKRLPVAVTKVVGPLIVRGIP